MELPVFGLTMLKTPRRYIPDFQPKNENNYFDPGCDFPTGEYIQVEKPVVVTTSY